MEKADGCRRYGFTQAVFDLRTMKVMPQVLKHSQDAVKTGVHKPEHLLTDWPALTPSKVSWHHFDLAAGVNTQPSRTRPQPVTLTVTAAVKQEEKCYRRSPVEFLLGTPPCTP